jgi:ketosteroid isomerase-like protein
MTTPDELAANKEVVREFFLQLEKGDVDAAFALYAEDGEWCLPRGDVTVPLPEQADNLKWFLSQMEHGIHFHFGVFTAEEDRVALTLEGHASLVNGKDYDQIYHMLFQLRDGQIRRSWEYADSYHTVEVLKDLPGVPTLAPGN